MKLNRLIAGIAASIMVLNSFSYIAYAADEPEQESLRALQWTTAKDGDFVADIPMREYTDSLETEHPADNEIVRVSIFLDQDSTLAAGYSTANIGENTDAMAYRCKLEQQQNQIETAISQILSNETEFDVVWNLTLAANLISANIPYGAIEKIRMIQGVVDVEIETQYTLTDEPSLPKDTVASLHMASSGGQIGSPEVWEQGFYGVGSKIAIIDTGIDLLHQSFDPGAYLCAISEREDTEIMVAADILPALGNLNAYKIAEKNGTYLTAETLYKNAKIPFGFNYVDGTADYIGHDQDGMGEHGSHVAGIAAANRLIPDDNNTYTDAVNEDGIPVMGVAPDAQIIIMKVYGKGGGAFDTDYFAAIEDAILLGADVINLSLGSTNPEFTYTRNEKFNEIFSLMEKSDTVITVSVGNSGAWSDSTGMENGTLYADAGTFDMIGAPGSYTDVLTIASVDNCGRLAYYLTTDNGDIIQYSESSYSNQLFHNFPGKQSFVMIDGFGTDEQFFEVSDLLRGSIAVCRRGGKIPFAEKANNAVKYGASAVIIINDENSDILMDLTGYTGTAPVVLIRQNDGDCLMQSGQMAVTQSGLTYITGSLTISGNRTVVSAGSLEVMSELSSWGVPGSLELKPEITAPGGSVLSVKGDSSEGLHNRYEVMSGTSMAAPQVAGMVALAAEYFEENLSTIPSGVTRRQLVQSLLMSTAKPLFDWKNNGYYSVMRQGAGLARIDSVVDAKSFIMMNSSASTSMYDGKVKAEIGDDPERKGEYSFSFTLNSLDHSDSWYQFDADFFTQKIYTGENGYLYTDQSTRSLDVLTSFTAEYVNGSPLRSDEMRFVDGKQQFRLRTDGVLTVSVYAILTDEEKALLDQSTGGAYIEGFVRVEETGNSTHPTRHSIPVLGYYGSWTDLGMFDVCSRWGNNDRDAYLAASYSSPADAVDTNFLTMKTSDDEKTYVFGGNPFVYVPDEQYMPERNALSSRNSIDSINYTLIRNAAYGKITISDSLGNQHEITLDAQYAAYPFLNTQGGVTWGNKKLSAEVNYTPESIPDGTEVHIRLDMIPEYYLTHDAVIGDGASMEFAFTVDSTPPVINSLLYDEDSKELTLAVTDNFYTAGILITNAGSEKVLKYKGSDPVAKAGDTSVYTFDMSNINCERLALQVMDYAMNTTTITCNLSLTLSDTAASEMLAFVSENNGNEGGAWLRFNEDVEIISSTAAEKTEIQFTAAAGADDCVYATDTDGRFYRLDAENLSDVTLIGKLSAITENGEIIVCPDDLAYDADNQVVYGIDDEFLWIIYPEDATIELLTDIPIQASTLTYDSGYFYFMESSSGDLFAFTMDELFDCSDFDVNGDGFFTAAEDGMAILEYIVKKPVELFNATAADMNGDGSITSYDAYLAYHKGYDNEIKEPVCATGLSGIGIQSIEADKGRIFCAYEVENNDRSDSFIYVIDPYDGTCIVAMSADLDFTGSLSTITFLPRKETDADGNTSDQRNQVSQFRVKSASVETMNSAEDNDYTFTVDLTVRDKNGSYLAAENGFFRIEYDPTLVDITTDIPFHEGYHAVFRETVAGELLIAFAAEDGCGIPAGGCAARLKVMTHSSELACLAVTTVDAGDSASGYTEMISKESYTIVITPTTVTLPTGSIKYRLGGGAWQADKTFTGLYPDTKYTFYMMDVENRIETVSVTTQRAESYTPGSYIDHSASHLPVRIAYSCSFYNNIRLNYYIRKQDLAEYSNIRIYLEYENFPNVSDTCEMLRVKLTNYTIENIDGINCLHFSFDGLKPWQMGCNVYATVYAEKGGVTYISSVDQYSISAYARKLLDTSNDSALKTLLADMLNYGAASQFYFGHNTDNPVTVTMTDQQKKYASVTNPVLHENSGIINAVNPLVSLKSVSIGFGSNISLKYYLNLPNNISKSSISISFDYIDICGQKRSVILSGSKMERQNQYSTENKQGYSIKYDGLSMYELGTVVNMTVYLDGQQISDTIRYSVESYAKKQLTRSSDTTLTQLMIRLMQYSRSAEQYFRNHK